MIVRELVTLIGFKVNQAEFAIAEKSYFRLRGQANSLMSLGRNMALFLSLPLGFMAKGIIQATSENEKLRMSFRAMIGDAQRADSFINKLYAFAQKSPLFRMADVGQAAKNVYAMAGGQVPLEKIIPLMQTLGRISAATGVNIKRLAYDYGTIQAMGYADWRHIRMLMSAGVPITDPLLSALGIKKGKDAVAQLMKLSRDRKITAAAVNTALESLTGPTGMFGGMETELNKSLWGKWQQFTDSVTLFAIQLGVKLLPYLKSFLNALMGFTSILSRLNPNILRFMWIFGGLFALIGPMILLGGLLKALIGPVGIIVGLTTILASAIDDIYVWVKGGKSIMGILFGDYARYKPIVDDIKKNVVSLFRDLAHLIGQLFTALGKLFALMGQGSAGMLALKALLTILDNVAIALDAIVKSLSFIIDMLPKLDEALSKAAGKAAGGARAGLQKVAENEFVAPWLRLGGVGVSKVRAGVGAGAEATAESAKLWGALLARIGGSIKGFGVSAVEPWLDLAQRRFAAVNNPVFQVEINAPGGDPRQVSLAAEEGITRAWSKFWNQELRDARSNFVPAEAP